MSHEKAGRRPLALGPQSAGPTHPRGWGTGAPPAWERPPRSAPTPNPPDRSSLGAWRAGPWSLPHPYCRPPLPPAVTASLVAARQLLCPSLVSGKRCSKTCLQGKAEKS